ncbi:MAG: hypothetical protein D6785_05580, partial [Planctomycetota bacterium]
MNHKKSYFFSFLLPFLLLVFLSLSCFEVEQSYELEKDFSGKMELSITYDLEKMAEVMASLQKSFSSMGSKKKKPKSKEEIKEKMLKSFREGGMKLPSLDKIK